MNTMLISLLVLLLVITAFITGKVPLSMIGSGIFILCLIFNLLPPERVFSTLTNSSIIMFAAMFIVGAAIQKTSIIDWAIKAIQVFKDKPSILILITGIVAFILGMVTSGTIAVIVLLPIINGICKEIKLPRSKIIYPMTVMASTGSGAWFLGTGALNMSWSSMMIKLGAKQGLNINDFFISRLPFAIVILLYMAFIAPKFLPTVSNENKAEKDSKGPKADRLTGKKNALAITLILTTIIAMMLSNYIKIPTYIIAVIGAFLLVACGVLENNEALRAINLNIIFLAAGMLTMADALTYTGAGKAVGKAMASVVGNIHNNYLMIGFFFLVSIVIVQFVGSLPMVTILVPLWTLTCVQMGLDPRGPVLVATAAGSLGFLTPMANPVYGLIMDVGGYKIKDYIKVGLPLTIILCIMGCFVTQTIYPL